MKLAGPILLEISSWYFADWKILSHGDATSDGCS